MSRFIATAEKFAAGEEGATMVEYGIMIALIAAVCIVIIASLGGKVRDNLFQSVDSQLI